MSRGGRRERSARVSDAARKRLLVAASCSGQRVQVAVSNFGGVGAMLAERDLEKGKARMRELDRLIAEEEARNA